MSTEVKVPNIGDFAEVEVIEVMVKVGDTIKVDQSLITVESDKASMEVPSARRRGQGTAVKVGDKVKEGSICWWWKPAPALPLLPAAAARGPAPAAAALQLPAPIVAPAGSSYSGQVDIDCDMMVLGGGPGGYSAAFRAPTWA
jgi:dihydrolipoamide dehydrogenase